MRWVWLAAAAGVLAPSAHDAAAYTLGNHSWPTTTVTFRVSIPGADGLWDQGFESALAIWNDATGFGFLILPGVYQDPCSLGSEPEGVNGVGFDDVTCSGAFGEQTLAVEHSWFIGSRTVNSGIVFNANKEWNVYSGPWEGVPADFQRVAVHELGHTLGLDHEDDVPAIMGTYASDVTHPTVDDVRGVWALYPSLDVPEPSAGALAAASLGTLGFLAIRLRRSRAGAGPGAPVSAGARPRAGRARPARARRTARRSPRPRRAGPRS